MYINHITLATGHTRRSPRAEVSGETMARVAPRRSALAVDDWASHATGKTPIAATSGALGCSRRLADDCVLPQRNRVAGRS